MDAESWRTRISRTQATKERMIWTEWRPSLRFGTMSGSREKLTMAAVLWLCVGGVVVR